MFFAVVLAWIIFLSPETSPNGNGGQALIGFVDTNSAAYAVGIRPGDRIVGVNGEKAETWGDYAILCLLGTGKTNVVTLALASDSGVRDVSVTTSEDEMGVRSVEGLARSMACVVDDVVEGRSAEKGGVMPGDIVRMCDGQVVASTQHFIKLVGERGGREMPLKVEREGVLLDLVVEPKFDALAGQALIGVYISSEFESPVTPWMQYRRPWMQIKNDASGIVRILKALVTPREAGQAAKGLGGPVMILTALWIAIKISLLNGVGFLRFLNVNLAILNLLPIPVLDGGHIVFALWEGITRRRAHPKVVNVLVNVFATLLICALILLSLRDIKRFPKILRAFGMIKSEEQQEEVQPVAADDRGRLPVTEAEPDSGDE